MTDATRVADDALDLGRQTANAVVEALRSCGDWGASGLKVGQYASDLVADAAAHEVLDAAGVGVLSEESGLVRPGAELVVIIDPLDGSTNASRGLPWWATSVCAVDAAGPVAAVVVDLVHGTRYEAVRGGGATRDGVALEYVEPGPWVEGDESARSRPAGGGDGRVGAGPSPVEDLSDAIVGISGLPPRSLGWRQFRALGAAALDLCAVADGRLDAYVDCSVDAHGVWDYAGALLICREAGATVVDALGRDLLVLDHSARRTPIAAGTAELCDALLGARTEAFQAPT